MDKDMVPFGIVFIVLSILLLVLLFTMLYTDSSDYLKTEGSIEAVKLEVNNSLNSAKEASNKLMENDNNTLKITDELYIYFDKSATNEDIDYIVNKYNGKLELADNGEYIIRFNESGIDFINDMYLQLSQEDTVDKVLFSIIYYNRSRS